MKPSWLKIKLPDLSAIKPVTDILRMYNIHTICESANCPNRGDCFSRKTATFLILGNVCTRRCQFCSVETGIPHPVDRAEVQNIVTAVRLLQLKHVVITSVTRDDLEDGGAFLFKEAISALRHAIPSCMVEILTPDFMGQKAAFDMFHDALPNVWGHNIETIPALYSSLRSHAQYDRSLSVLQNIKSLYRPVLVKTAVMVGLGEDVLSLKKVFLDLHAVLCDILIIGQYLQPSKQCVEVKKYYTLEEFQELKELAQRCGILHVVAHPFVRSSYLADEIYHAAGGEQ